MTSLKKTFPSLVLLAVCLFNSMLYASDEPIPITNTQEDNVLIDSPDLILESLINELMSLLQNQEDDFKPLVLFLQTKFARYIDFNYISRWSTRHQYRHLTPQQKLRLDNKLKQYILTSISDRFTGYEQSQIQFLPTQGDSEQATVPLLFKEADGQTDLLGFRFYPSKQGWKIFDITHNGHTLLQAYRHYFDGALR